MNIQQARKILNIPENSEINEETIKKYFHT